MRPNRFAALILLLIIAALCARLWAQKTVTISARNWGPDSVARDAAIGEHFLAFANANNATGDISWLAQYEYALTDSAVSILDGSQQDPQLLRRFFDPRLPQPEECEVSPVWATVSRHSPGKLKYAKFSTWAGGPYHTGVKPLPPGLQKQLNAEIGKARAKVEADMADGKEWTRKKYGKKLTNAEKRAAAWRIATGKDKEADYGKKAK